MSDEHSAWVQAAIAEGRLSRIKPNMARAGELITIARKHLVSAESVAATDPTLALRACHDAVRKAIDGHAGAHGLRIENVQGHHKLVLDYADRRSTTSAQTPCATRTACAIVGTTSSTHARPSGRSSPMRSPSTWRRPGRSSRPSPSPLPSRHDHRPDRLTRRGASSSVGSPAIRSLLWHPSHDPVVGVGPDDRIRGCCSCARYTGPLPCRHHRCRGRATDDRHSSRRSSGRGSRG